MDANLRLPVSADGRPAANTAAAIPPDTSRSGAIEDAKSRNGKRKSKKKEHTLALDSASPSSSSTCFSSASCSRKRIKMSRNYSGLRVGSLAATRKYFRHSDVDALGLPLGMSIAAVVSQVLERKNAAGEKMSVDYLSGICIMAVRESLGNVFGDKFDNFVTNFERSFRSTLMTLRLISNSSQNVGEQLHRAGFRSSFSMESDLLSHDKLNGSTVSCKSSPLDTLDDFSYPNSNTEGFDRLPHKITVDGMSYLHEKMGESVGTKFESLPLVLLHEKQIEKQIDSKSLSTSSINQSSILTTMEKSIEEQSRANNLKTFEIGLIMKKMQLKEKQLALNSHANLLEKWKLSMGFSKVSFKAEKFKTQLQDTRQVELLKKCLDFLVAGLIMMLLSVAYGTYVYSHRRIIEATEACSPYMVSNKSWWMPKSMATFNSGLQLLACQIQVFSRMLFGGLMIGAIAFLLIKRSATSHQTMPLTFILLLLGVGCGYAGKFCIDTLGGSGSQWLIYWEALCLLHFFSNTFHPILLLILNGPVVVTERVKQHTTFPYWMRRFLFFAILLFLPLLCGFLPFASAWEWYSHFTSQASDFMTIIDD